MNKTLIGAASALSLLVAAPAMAASATATTDLNLRAGPGPDYAVVDTLAAHETAEVEGCLETGPWCRVRHDGATAWANRAYLSGSQEIKTPIRAASITIRPDEDATQAEIDAAVVSGTLIDAPEELNVRIPEEAIAIYMTKDASTSTLRDGDVAIAGENPDGVAVHTLPESDVTYLTIDGESRILEPGTKTTVYINR